MKRYMRIREYCKESGFPEKTLRRLCRTYKAGKFSRRTGEAINSHILINVAAFERMWDDGEFKECI